MQVKNKETIDKILNILNESLRENNGTPSIYEIADAINVNPSTVSRYINYLVSEGIIERKGKHCNLTTSKFAKTMSNVTAFPIVGDVACGSPILAEENIESYVSISTEFFGPGEYFILKAKGESMINAGVNDGDLVVIRKQDTANEGQIVVALTDDGEATLKRYFLDKKHKLIRLHPENDALQDMFYKNIQIQGIAVKVIKDLL